MKPTWLCKWVVLTLPLDVKLRGELVNYSIKEIQSLNNTSDLTLEEEAEAERQIFLSYGARGSIPEEIQSLN